MRSRFCQSGVSRSFFNLGGTLPANACLTQDALGNKKRH